jgi:predicted  nucleic acid-binding Zn-ribbon protein
MAPILLGRRDNFKPGPPLIGRRGFGLKDLSRRANKLRRRVYREMPVASANRTAELDHRMCYADMAAILENARLGASSAGAALALWRAYSEHGLRAWCYRFGFPESLTQTVTIVDIDGVLQVHDAFFNLSYPYGFYEVLGSLRNGEAVSGKREVRDRKVYIMDPAREPSGTARWLEEHADREHEPVDGLRRFELLWDPEAFVATCPAIEPLFRDLTARGYSADPQFLMLHPVAVFDGTKWHRNRADMPLLRGYNMESPIAALRVASRDLETERARLAETTAVITRLEADLVEAKSQSSAALRRFSAERETWLQQKAALQAGNSALKGELADTQSRLSSAVDLRAQRDSQIAQLRAEIDDAARQSELQQNALDALQGQQREWDAARQRLVTEIRDLRSQLEAGSHESEQLRQNAVALASRVEAADEQVIAISHYIPPLIDEISRLRCERDAISHERGLLAAQIAASPQARLRSLWRRFISRRETAT